MSYTVLLSVTQQWLLRQIREFLHGAGLSVMEAATEDVALRILCESRPEVGLLLLEASAQDAPRLARQAARCRPGMKILLLSSDPDFVNRALMPEAEVGFLEKPFAWCELKSKLDELMGDEALRGERVMRTSFTV